MWRRDERGADRVRTFLGQPEPVFGIVRWMLSQSAGEPEDQVVARLFGEKERHRGIEEGGRVLEAANVHGGIVGTAHNYNPPRS